jgi:hypothetical protein
MHKEAKFGCIFLEFELGDSYAVMLICFGGGVVLLKRFHAIYIVLMYR